MKTSLEFPDPVLQRFRSDAAKEILALEVALDAIAPEDTDKAWELNPETGYPVSRSGGKKADSQKVGLAQFLAIMEQANEEDALSRAGVPC
jgi:hypothetical protein